MKCTFLYVLYDCAYWLAVFGHFQDVARNSCLLVTITNLGFKKLEF